MSSTNKSYLVVAKDQNPIETVARDIETLAGQINEEVQIGRKMKTIRVLEMKCSDAFAAAAAKLTSVKSVSPNNVNTPQTPPSSPKA